MYTEKIKILLQQIYIISINELVGNEATTCNGHDNHTLGKNGEVNAGGR